MHHLAKMDLSQLPVTHQEVIPEGYLDSMNHMNVAWYTHLFGTATMSFYRLFGLNREYMEANHSGIFALEAHIRYVGEVRVGQHVTLRSRALARNEKRLHFIHFMEIDETKRLSSFCEFVAGHMDMLTRRMSAILEPVGTGFDKLLAEHRALAWEPPVCGSMGP